MINRSRVFFRFCLLKLATTRPSTGNNNTAYNGPAPLPPGGTVKAAVFRKVVMFRKTGPEPGVAGGGLKSQLVPAGWPLQLKLTGPSGTAAFMVNTNVAVSPRATVTLPDAGVMVSTGPGGMISKVADAVLPVPPLVEVTAPVVLG